MQERIIVLLNDINERIISYNGENLFTDGILDSFSVIDVVVKLEEEFEIEIDADYVIEENFKTKEAIISLMEKLLG